MKPPLWLCLWPNFNLYQYMFQFSHIGNPHINPESLTATMQKQIFNIEATSQIDKKLPQMYKVREKKPVNTFPFSIHDNRHCLLNVGEYLDSGLGLKKFQQETCQHHSQNLLGTQEPSPSGTKQQSTYQTSFIQYSNTGVPFWGRFPKSHVVRASNLKPTAKSECLWFSKCDVCPNNLVPVKSDRHPHSESEQPVPAEQVTGVKVDCKANSFLDL